MTDSLTKSEALEALKTVDQRVEGAMTMSEYDQHRDENHPPSGTLAVKFGWNDLKEQAGLGKNPLGVEPLSRDEVIEALKAVDRRAEGTLSYDRYESLRDDAHPTAATISTKFGWNDIKEQAGLETSQQGQPGLSREDAVEILKTVNERVNGTLTQAKYQECKDPNHPHPISIHDKFGWNDVKRDAGLKVHRRDNVSKSAAINAVKTVSQRVDGDLTTRAYDEHRCPKHPAAKTISRKFGWEDIKQEAKNEIFRTPTTTTVNIDGMATIRRANGSDENVKDETVVLEKSDRIESDGPVAIEFDE